MGPPGEAGTHEGGQLQELELPRLLNLEKKSSERFKWTHLEQVQYYNNLFLQVTLLTHTSQVNTEPGLR